MMDESLDLLLYTAIGAGLGIVLVVAGRQFVAGLLEARREMAARRRRPDEPRSAAERVVQRRQ
jgi:hypothetical protein